MEYVSASRINTYLMCPLKYRFRYIENISPKFKNSGLAFGSAVHSALNWVHEYMLAGEKPGLEDALRIFRADWASQQVETINYKKGESREGLQKLGEQLISIYYAEYPDLKVRATERPFKVPLEDLTTGESFEVPLFGYFDLVLDDDVLVEIKTAKRDYGVQDLQRNIQLSAYAYAYRRIYGTDPKLKLTALLKAKTPRISDHAVERPASGDRWFVHLAASVVNSIQSEAFPPSPGWQCGDCEYSQECSSFYECRNVKPQLIAV